MRKKKSTPVPLALVPLGVVPISNTSSFSAREGYSMKKPSIALLFSVTLAGCMGYVPGQQSYWDAQVREMCEKDGGVRIFEQIVVSSSEINLLPKVGDFFGVVSEALAKPGEPAFTRIQRTVIRESNPSVIRYEEEIVRRVDRHVVGVVVSYGRGGGDLPSPAHPSNYHCPAYKQLYEGIHRVYRIEGIKK